MDVDPELIPWTEHLRRREQKQIDTIVKGDELGHYYVLLGPKVRVVCNPSVHVLTDV